MSPNAIERLLAVIAEKANTISDNSVAALPLPTSPVVLKVLKVMREHDVGLSENAIKRKWIVAKLKTALQRGIILQAVKAKQLSDANLRAIASDPLKLFETVGDGDLLETFISDKIGFYSYAVFLFTRMVKKYILLLPEKVKANFKWKSLSSAFYTLDQLCV